jgi:hypothetical protein
MGPIGFTETSVENYHSTLRNIPEERRSQLHRGGSLKSLKLAGSCEYVNEHSSSIRDKVFPDSVQEYYVLKDV